MRSFALLSLGSVLFWVNSVVGQPASTPAVSITLGTRQATATPERQGFTHTGGGNIDVAQPGSDALVVTLTGVAVAGAHPCKNSSARLTFNLSQEFEISFDKPDVKSAKLTLEGRMIGLLRCHAKGDGAAEFCSPTVAITQERGKQLIAVGLPARSVAGGENLSINDHIGPMTVPITAGKYVLHQSFALAAEHPRNLAPCKAASAEFAPDPALDPLWISYWEPFHGANKKDFGFQIILKVSPDNGAAAEKAKP